MRWGSLMNRHLTRLRAAPFGIGAVALVLGGSHVLVAHYGGADAALLMLGFTIGIVGIVGTTAAAIDARRTSKDTRALILRGEAAATDARSAAGEARRAAERVRLLADDLGAASRAERVARIKSTVRAIAVRTDLATLSGVAESDALAQPLDWFELSRCLERLSGVLTTAGHLSVPRSWSLYGALFEAFKSVDPTPREIDPSANPHASQDHVEHILSAARQAYAEVDRPADQIPLNSDPSVA